jgi:hypothetical protein
VIGQTSPEPKLTPQLSMSGAADGNLVDPRNVEDLHATVLHALGIDFAQEVMTPIGRPMALSKGKVIRELLA